MIDLPGIAARGAVAAFLLWPTAALAQVSNTIAIADKSGTASTGYPFQFGRLFVQGEIANYPQALVNGAPVATQADVKNRWPDGSVKFAVLATVVPTIPANGSVVLSFANQASGNNTPLTQAQMLGANYNFDAKIQIANGTQTLSASARAMLTAGACTPWTSGQIAQTMLCADDNAARAYDMGFDALKSVRPRFYATFWPATNQVAVRYVGENSNSEALEDVKYDLTLTLGNTAPVSASKAGVVHYAATRWTMPFWLGGTPQNQINIDHNLAYLAATRLFPNYDTSVRPGEATIADQYAKWQTQPKDLYDAGSWVIYMPQTGQTAGPAVGPYPVWVALWLYTGDWRAREQSLTNADRAGAWPLQVREGQAGRNFVGAVPALGLPISIVARPGIRLFDDRYTDADQVKIKGTRILNADGQRWNGWAVDNAHEPDPFSAAYALTGDYYYLEQMNLWSSADAAYVGPEYRGPAGSGYGGIKEQVRGEAWALRNRTLSAMLSPDGAPEKDYFSQITNDAIALWEGQRGITGTAFTGNPEWTWGSKPENIPPQSPLHPWRVDMPTLDSDQYQYQGGNALADGELWMNYMMIYSLGLAKERGFPTGALLTWAGNLLTAQISESGYDPRFMASYVTPFGDPTAGLYTRWAQTSAKLTPEAQAANLKRFDPGEVNTYGLVGATAAAMITNEAGGAATWSWIVPNVRSHNDYTADFYAWNIIPRGDIVITPPATAALTATPAAIIAGGNSMLSYRSANATACTGVGFMASGTSGIVNVSPPVSITYSITCTGPGGTSAPASATVAVAPIVAGDLKIGARVKTTVAVPVTRTPNGRSTCTQPAGATGIIESGPSGRDSSWKVNFDTLCDGYVIPSALALQ